MLPNLNVVICGIVLSVILFVATGNGIIVPESYTRVAKPPEVIRPMTQAIVTDEPARAQFNVMTAERRDPGPLRQQAAVPVSEPVSAPRDGAPRDGAEPVLPANATPVAVSGPAIVAAAAQPVGDLAPELRIGDVAGHSTPATVIASPQPEHVTALAQTAATDAVKTGPATARAPSSEAGTAASMSAAKTSEPRGGETQDAVAADPDPTDSTSASTLASAAHAAVRPRRARPASHNAAVAAHKPVVRHARARVPLPAPSPAAAAPNAATPVTGLFGQTNFNAAPPHQ
jgi:hypothetical protein